MGSIWSQTCNIKRRPALPGDKSAEVAVIGAGLAGLLTAAALQEAGLEVLVLEAETIAAGQTKNTTAKMTCQHGLIYSRLVRSQGKEQARLYAQANQAALAQYRRWIKERGIDCDLEERDSYVYGDDLPALEVEAQTAAELGLTASLVRETPLPFSTGGAVRFSSQAQFHPLKFMDAVAAPLTVYEMTPVSRVEGDLIITKRGRVRARHIVFACHFPFVNFPGLYFARMHQERSYVLALENAGKAKGMWVGIGKESYSLRDWGDLLLLGGGGHRCGENSRGGRYDDLRQKASFWFPGSREVSCWSAQDCMTADDVPYIGHYAPSRPNWFVATGFRKWGMTTSMVSALLLRDLICGKSNPWAPVFDPARFDAKTVSGVAEEGGQAVKGLARRFFHIPAEQAGDLEAGHGGLVELEGEKAGVYKDEAGSIFAVDVRCPHLGCQLEWNSDELSWDCPCHGSRFDHLGRLISGPAQEDLAHG